MSPPVLKGAGGPEGGTPGPVGDYWSPCSSAVSSCGVSGSGISGGALDDMEFGWPDPRRIYARVRDHRPPVYRPHTTPQDWCNQGNTDKVASYWMIRLQA